MTKEYERMGLITKESCEAILSVLQSIDKSDFSANPEGNMSDICFAIERYVENTLSQKLEVNWHVDRSRNDVQATAQLMFGRQCLRTIIDEVISFTEDIVRLAGKYSSTPMPGYTHYQSAQIMTVGFYLTAMSEALQKSVDKMFSVYFQTDECPLGSGAMAGMELSWDRAEMARTLGFSRYCRHALVGVASKEWMLSIANEWSVLAVNISRFITDFIAWGSSEYKFVALPDELSGISSAMPQKKNFPIFERIRGKTVHISSYSFDILISQRNTPFTNLVETAKEGGSNFNNMYETMRSVIRLFRVVIQNITFDQQRMYAVCSSEFFGGFSLANLLTLEAKIPYRQAQVAAGTYIVTMLEKNLLPSEVSAEVLNEICARMNYSTSFTDDQLLLIFDVEMNIFTKTTEGSTNPKQVGALIEQQKHKILSHISQLDNLLNN